MKILLDECVPQELCKHFIEHECHAARHVGLDGTENGALLNAAESAGYDVLVTIDRNIPHQQNLARRGIALIVIECRSNNLRHLVPQIPGCLLALESITPGQIVSIRPAHGGTHP